MNGHVNNVEYMRWILDSVPEELRRAHTCGSITLEYKSEAEAGSEIACATAEPAALARGGGRGLLHSIAPSAPGGGEIVRGVSSWLPRGG